MEIVPDQPTTISERFRMTYIIESVLPAPQKAVWARLSDQEALLEWDSMLMELTGDFKPGGKIKLRSKLSPRQVFRLTVSEFEPPHRMVWRSGRKPLFQGVRTYELEPRGKETFFRMQETFSGWMLPLMRSQLPDCETLFGTYIRDLQKALPRD